MDWPIPNFGRWLRCYKQLKLSLIKGKDMKPSKSLIWTPRIALDTQGQDLIEYALLAGFVALAAGAIMPNVATSISTIFSKVADTMSTAANAGS